MIWGQCRIPILVLVAFFSLSNAAEAQLRCSQPIGNFASVQGIVEVHSSSSRVEVGSLDRQRWQQVTIGMSACPNDWIHVGPLSRATVVLRDLGVQHLNENTVLKLPDLPREKPSLFDLVQGVTKFFSNEPHHFDIETPFVNAGVEGTEFVVSVENDQTVVTVLEGRVVADNPHGRVVLTANQQAVARAGEVPVVRIPVAPRDTVQWAVYYPPILSDLATGSGPISVPDLPMAIREAIELVCGAK
jgi:hypothetical protein